MVEQVIQLEDGWVAIKAAIDKLVEILADTKEPVKPFTPSEYIEVYTKCYNMCTQRNPSNWSQSLYARHGETIHEYLVSKVMPILKEKRDEFLLKEMVARWKNHEIMDKWMRKFFMYLDRYYVKHNSIPTLHEASLEKFRTLIFEGENDDFVAAILVQINKEREGEVVDRGLLKQCVAVFGKMGDKLRVYAERLERPLLESTRAFYAKKAQEWIAEDTLPVYLLKAEAALETERERVDNYLEASTKAKLQEALEEELLAKHEATLLEKEGSGCRALLQDEKKADLSRLFKLFSNVTGGLEPIASIVKEHIAKMGEDIVEKRELALSAAASQKERDALDPVFVQSLLDLHAKFQALVEQQFQGDAKFGKALKEAFEVFVNHDVGKTTNAELISTFCDRILKTGGAKLSDTDMEEKLERTVQLFSFLSDKDLFAEVYRNQLSKRLLMGRSASDDAEKSIIAKLKLRCGSQFTSKMEGMIKDLLTGEEFKKAFKDMVRSAPSKVNADGKVAVSASPSGDMVLVDAVEFGVEVLTTGYWPTYKMVEVTLPKQLSVCMETYERFYADKTDHRKLKWVHSLGNALVRASYKRGYELQVTTLQAVALLAFNDGSEHISLQDLTLRLNMDEEVTKRVMHSLSCAKHKVLLKTPPSKGIGRGDKFSINEGFQSPMRKLRLPMASLDESHNTKRVEEDRTIAIEAAIVRIMKARKTLTHVQLVAETIQQLHFFKPNPRAVKRRIEHLIEREYLERRQEDPNCYNYLA